MEVLCLGMSRTGTSSLREALFQLGYHDVYHGVSAVHQNPRDCEMWLDAYKALKDGDGQFGRREWDQLLGHCMAVTDDPCASFARELIEAYPDARVILTVRDSPEAWCRSIERTIWKWGSRWWAERGIFYDFYLWLRGANNPLFLMTKRSWYQSGYHEFPTKRGKLYEEHNKYVKSLVPAERLLVFNLKEGWAPLCAFLGKDVPLTPFPRINDSEEFQRKAEAGNRMLRRRALVNGIKLLTGVGVVAVVGIAWATTLKLLIGR
ncbi:hypothetical protein GTA08_BOTSDO03742 [Neofusicoccum parvum]|uniref:Uncharacterized protein n=1 Tax=Neofusicoccum parvum TaxID=310453 RepID=A0ACB5SET3_9PEZI|nr:hypothetical protein GTA08_BOTSDO03742 [Neofusicoccum parvum]